jgi:hypothetical protein
LHVHLGAWADYQLDDILQPICTRGEDQALRVGTRAVIVANKLPHVEDEGLEGTGVLGRILWWIAKHKVNHLRDAKTHHIAPARDTNGQFCRTEDERLFD